MSNEKAFFMIQTLVFLIDHSSLIIGCVVLKKVDR
jgi:hypothetical protein